MFHVREFCRACIPVISHTRGMSRSQHWRVMEEAAPKYVQHVIKQTKEDTRRKVIDLKDHWNEPMIVATGEDTTSEETIGEDCFREVSEHVLGRIETPAAFAEYWNENPWVAKRRDTTSEDTKEETTVKLKVADKNIHELGESDLSSFKYFTSDEVEQLCSFNKRLTVNKYMYLTSVFDCGFIQFREHMLNLYPKAESSCKKYIVTGRQGTGKSMTCYGAMLSAKEQKQMCVPLLRLDEWLVDTKESPTNVVMVKEDGKMKEKWEVPNFNTSFLSNFLSVNEAVLTDDHVLLRDCYWAPFHYSIKGTTLREVIQYGIKEPAVSNAIIKELCLTLIESKVPLSIVVDDIDMLHHIPETLFRSHRSPKKDWWNQLNISLDRFLLFTYIQDMINSLETGNVYLATGKDNSPEAIATINNAFKDLEEVCVPGAPSASEYEGYLQFMRHHKFLARDLSVGEVNELKFLTGMGYEYTYTMMLRI